MKLSNLYALIFILILSPISLILTFIASVIISLFIYFFVMGDSNRSSIINENWFGFLIMITLFLLFSSILGFMGYRYGKKRDANTKDKVGKKEIILFVVGIIIFALIIFLIISFLSGVKL